MSSLAKKACRSFSYSRPVIHDVSPGYLARVPINSASFFPHLLFINAIEHKFTLLFNDSGFMPRPFRPIIYLIACCFNVFERNPVPPFCTRTFAKPIPQPAACRNK